jgi:hypothetical protein
LCSEICRISNIFLEILLFFYVLHPFSWMVGYGDASCILIPPPHCSTWMYRVCLRS